MQDRLQVILHDIIKEKDGEAGTRYLANLLSVAPPSLSISKKIIGKMDKVPGATVGCIWCKKHKDLAHKPPHKWTSHKKHGCPEYCCSVAKVKEEYLVEGQPKFKFFLPILSLQGKDTGTKTPVCRGTFEEVYGKKKTALLKIKRACLNPDGRTPIDQRAVKSRGGTAGKTALLMLWLC